MSKINNLKESWNNHTFKEVENCIKEAFEAADNKVDSIAKLDARGTIVDIEGKSIANVHSIGAVSEGGFAGSIEQAHTVFIGGIDLDDTPIRNVDEIDAQTANMHEVNADNIKTKTINITGTKPPTGRLKVVTSRVESEGESENVDLITYDADNHDLNIGAEIQGAKVNVHGTINGDNNLHITGGAIFDETLHVEEGAYVGENLEVGEDLIMREGAIVTNNGALALPKDKSNRETLAVRSDLTSLFDNVYYDSNNKTILFKHGDTTLKTLNAAPFIKDGMVSNVAVVGNNIVISFNTDSGKEDIEIPIVSIFDADAYVAKRVYNSVAEMEAATDIKQGTFAIVKGKLRQFTFDPSKLPTITSDDYGTIVELNGRSLYFSVLSDGPGYVVNLVWSGGSGSKRLYTSYYGNWPEVVCNLVELLGGSAVLENHDFGMFSDCVSNLIYDNELYYYENGWIKLNNSSVLTVPIVREGNPGQYTYTNVNNISSTFVNDMIMRGVVVQYVLSFGDITSQYPTCIISAPTVREYRGFPAFIIQFPPCEALEKGLTLGHNMESINEENGISTSDIDTYVLRYGPPESNPTGAASWSLTDLDGNSIFIGDISTEVPSRFFVLNATYYSSSSRLVYEMMPANIVAYLCNVNPGKYSNITLDRDPSSPRENTRWCTIAQVESSNSYSSIAYNISAQSANRLTGGKGCQFNFDSNDNLIFTRQGSIKVTIPKPSTDGKTVAFTDEILKQFATLFTHIVVFNGLNATSCTLYTSNGSETISTAGALKNKLPTASTTSYSSCLVIIKQSQTLYGDCYIGKVYSSTSQYGINTVTFICSNFVDAQIFFWKESEPLQKKYKTTTPYSQYSDYTLATLYDVNFGKVIFNGTTYSSGSVSNINNINAIFYKGDWYTVSERDILNMTVTAWYDNSGNADGDIIFGRKTIRLNCTTKVVTELEDTTSQFPLIQTVLDNSGTYSATHNAWSVWRAFHVGRVIDYRLNNGTTITMLRIVSVTPDVENEEVTITLTDGTNTYTHSYASSIDSFVAN